VLLASLTATASPQLFALAREYADSRNKQADMFSSVLRAQFSLAWVIGPPIAFALAIGYGFKVMYLASALAYVICAFVVWRWLPSLPLPVMDSEVERVSSWRDPSVRALFIASTLMWTCNSMYLINMPLYITRELGLEEKLAGLLMGTAAALEIPFMLLAGYYTRRFGKRPMMLLAVLAGVGFYGGLVTLSSQHALIALQLLNAIFIGIVAGIGMSYFQDLMPGAPGWQPPCSPTASAPAPSWREPLPALWRRSGVSTGSLWWLPHWRWLHWPPAGGCPTYRGCKGADADERAPVPRSCGEEAALPGVLSWYSMRRQRSSSSARPQRLHRGGEQVGVEIALVAAGEIELHQRAFGELLLHQMAGHPGVTHAKAHHVEHLMIVGRLPAGVVRIVPVHRAVDGGMQAYLVVAGQHLGGDGLSCSEGVARCAQRKQTDFVQRQAGAILGQVLGEHQISCLQRIEVAVDPLVQVDAATAAAGIEVGQRPVEALPRLHHGHIEVDLRPHCRSRLLARFSSSSTCWLSWRARLRKISPAGVSTALRPRTSSRATPRLCCSLATA
jgi:hypothetical protein